MRAEGLEPPRSFEHQDLNLDCLPVPARPQIPGQSGGTQGIVAAMADTVLVHPNRDKSEAKVTRAIVIVLLLVSAALILIVMIGGWAELQGAQVIAFVLAAIYIGMAFFVTRWNRGVLPVAAGLAVLFSVIAAVAGPAWFERDKAGFDQPTLDPSILGILTLALVPVQLLLVGFAMRGFQQQWNVEVELPRDEAQGYG